MRHQLAGPASEARALAYLVIACLLIFVAQWPRLLGQISEVPPEARIGGALFGWLFLAPLAFYALAALARLVAGAMGGRGTWYTSRLALFWALFAAAPLWLLNGLTSALAMPRQISAALGLVALLAFVVLWAMSMVEAETDKPT
jgi:hypothetical protein